MIMLSDHCSAKMEGVYTKAIRARAIRGDTEIHEGDTLKIGTEKITAT